MFLCLSYKGLHFWKCAFNVLTHYKLFFLNCIVELTNDDCQWTFCSTMWWLIITSNSVCVVQIKSFSSFLIKTTLIMQSLIDVIILYMFNIYVIWSFARHVFPTFGSSSPSLSSFRSFLLSPLLPPPSLWTRWTYSSTPPSPYLHCLSGLFKKDKPHGFLCTPTSWTWPLDKFIKGKPPTRLLLTTTSPINTSLPLLALFSFIHSYINVVLGY